MDVKPVKVEATVMWAFLNKVNDMSGKYQVDLCDLDDKAVSDLQSIGIEVKFNPEKEEKGRYITCKSKNYPIPAVDVHGKDIDVAVANGSKAKALVGAYEWKFKGKTGVSPSIKKMVITELREFIPSDDEEMEEETL